MERMNVDGGLVLSRGRKDDVVNPNKGIGSRQRSKVGEKDETMVKSTQQPRNLDSPII